MSVHLWVDQNDLIRSAALRSERQTTYRSPVLGRDPEAVRLIAERKRITGS